MGDLVSICHQKKLCICIAGAFSFGIKCKFVITPIRTDSCGKRQTREAACFYWQKQVREDTFIHRCTGNFFFSGGLKDICPNEVLHRLLCIKKIIVLLKASGHSYGDEHLTFNREP